MKKTPRSRRFFFFRKEKFYLGRYKANILIPLIIRKGMKLLRRRGTYRYQLRLRGFWCKSSGLAQGSHVNGDVRFSIDDVRSLSSAALEICISGEVAVASKAPTSSTGVAKPPPPPPSSSGGLLLLFVIIYVRVQPDKIKGISCTKICYRAR